MRLALFKLRLFLLVVVLSTFFPLGAAEGVKITELPGKLRIEINGKHFSDYIYEGMSRPVLYPLLDAEGVNVTRHWPLKEGMPDEEHDHPHHRSWWYAHGDINGHDFWSENKTAGKTVHAKFLAIESGAKKGVIKSANNLMSQAGQRVASDERTLTFYATKDQRVFDFSITMFASEGPLKFGDTKEGTLAIRLAETMRLKGKVGKGHIVNSEGIRDADTWGKRAAWVDYYGPVEGKIRGVAIFDHPSNPRHPTWWHVRDYGLFAVNPFGLHDFEKKPKGSGDLIVPAGEKITFNYRFVIHAGDEKEGKVKEQFDQYAKISGWCKEFCVKGQSGRASQ